MATEGKDMTTHPHDTGDAKPTCVMCGSTTNVSRQPSRKTLLFGPFRTENGPHVTYENRCGRCEWKVSLWVDRTIRNMTRATS